MGLGQCILNTVLLNLWQLYGIDEKQYDMGPFKNQKSTQDMSAQNSLLS